MGGGQVLHAATNVNPTPAGDATDVSVVDGGALLAASGPDGTAADITTEASSTQISIYVVRDGDSLAKIAQMFGVSRNTILWANNLKKASDVRPGDTLAILPVSGVEHLVTKGETLGSILKKYHGDLQDVLDFNNLSADSEVAVGDTIIIPDGIDGPSQPPIVTPPSKGKVKNVSGTATSGSAGSVGTYERLLPGYGGAAIPGYFVRPVTGVKTQGLHGYNGIDIGTPVGTTVVAAAEGTIIIARGSGYNGGYGEYVAIDHPNGTQTVYGHLSKVYVTPGAHVDQGEMIGLSGNSGRSTGPHLHFEVRGAANPF